MHISHRSYSISATMLIYVYVYIHIWLVEDWTKRQVAILQWRHNGRDSVSNHQPHDCLPNHLFRRRSKKTSKLRVNGLCVGNSPVTGEFPAKLASNAENFSIWWRHHDNSQCHIICHGNTTMYIEIKNKCIGYAFGSIHVNMGDKPDIPIYKLPDKVTKLRSY